MEPNQSHSEAARSKSTVRSVLGSYFYWTFPRGSFHYDIMVTLILAFIFVTPHLWNYGDKPSPVTGPLHPIQVSGNGGHGVIVTVRAADVYIPRGSNDSVVKEALREAIEPVTGDTVFVEHWETATDEDGNRVWKVWVHR